MTEQLFDRQGNEYTGTVLYTETGRPYYKGRKVCHRCGGQGGAGWHPSGLDHGRCFNCGGALYFPVDVKLYTKEKLAKLNENAAKRAAKKAEAARIKAEAEERRRQKDQKAALAEAKPFIDRIEALGLQEKEGFIGDIYNRVTTKAMFLSDRQIEALERVLTSIEEQNAIKEASEFIGNVKDRVELELIFDRSIFVAEAYFYNGYDTYLTICHTPDGNVVIYKGRRCGLDFERDEQNYMIKGSTTRVKATIKEHKVYDGVKQTVINRPKVI